jgi:uncharacterized protein (DUF1810 family)
MAMPEINQHDPYNLERFLEAQDPVFEDVCSELRAGSKRSHWMWFIFPQMKGLGHSSMATYYAISGLQEAREYLQHGILGPRLVECCELVTAIRGRPIEEVFGQVDSLKFHSSITLFAQAAPENQAFQAALQKYFKGKDDSATLQLLSR